MATTSCTAGCALPVTDVVEAGLHLGLCLFHLIALRNSCKGKQRFPYAKLAANEARRLVDVGAVHRPGRTPTAYRCRLCPDAWHVGHQEHGGDGHPEKVAAAAAAVRARLSEAQLSHLCATWAPTTSRRPGNRRARPGRRR